jgi:hypothetical protein
MTNGKNRWNCIKALTPNGKWIQIVRMDENLNDFINLLPKLESSSSLQPSMTNHPFIYEFGSCLVT